MAEATAGRPELLRRLRDEIRARGPMSFARFMDLALHDPEHGYYAQGARRLGRTGDFFTASDVGSAFGSCLARQIVEMDALLGHPAPLRYIEHGAGRGLLARDVLDALARRDPDVAARVEATLVDASRGMREAARAAAPEARVVAPDELAPGGAGCVVAVELLDALPVHRVRRRPGGLVEVKVALDGDRLVEVEGAPGDDVLAWGEAYGAAPELGDEAEVPLGLAGAVAALAAGVERGFVLIVDYGHEARRLFGPAHNRGTLLAYHRHAAHEDYLARVGEQDLTAHVNLTALEREAVALGLAPVGRVTQDRFLVANGILDDLPGEGDASPEATQRRMQAKQLLHPYGMGRVFQVAAFAKGIAPAPVLRGLADPFGASVGGERTRPL